MRSRSSRRVRVRDVVSRTGEYGVSSVTEYAVRSSREQGACGEISQTKEHVMRSTRE